MAENINGQKMPSDNIRHLENALAPPWSLLLNAPKLLSDELIRWRNNLSIFDYHLILILKDEYAFL